MTRLQKAKENLENKDIWCVIKNDTLYVEIGDSELELSDFEINYQAKEYDKSSIFEEYDFRNFTNVDPDENGVEVSQDGELLGVIYDVSIPDENDDEETEQFISEVQSWLDEN